MNADHIRVLAVAGSLRRNSVNRLVLRAAAQSAPPGMTIAVYEDLGDVPLFNEDLEVGAGPPAVQALRRAVAESDGLLLATPEYNHSLSGVMKNAIDWLSRPGLDPVLVGKPVAVLGATSGIWGTRLAQAALRQTLNAAQCLVLPQPGVFVRQTNALFTADGQLSDDTVRAELRAHSLAFAQWIGRLGVAAAAGLTQGP